MALHPPQQKTPVLSTAAAAAANALATGQVTGTNAPASGSTDYTLLTVTATVNQTGTASGNTTAVKVNLVETAALGPTYLCDYQIGGVSKWSIRGTAPITSAIGATWDGYKASALTQLFKGNTRIQTASGINKIAFYAPTLIGDTATLTIDQAATVYISGPPVAGTNVTITNAAALVVASGKTGLGTNAPAHILDIVAGNVDGIKITSSVNCPIVKLHTASGNSGARNWALTSQFTTDGVFQLMRSTARAAEVSVIAWASDKDSNFILGGITVAGASAAKCLVLSNAAVAPSASADLAHVYAADIAAGRTTLALWAEEAVAADASLTSTHSFTKFINGAKYKEMLVAVA
jgi:hypothetical protein